MLCEMDYYSTAAAAVEDSMELTPPPAKRFCENLHQKTQQQQEQQALLEEGIFVFLPDEMRLEIFSKLIEENNWESLNTASRVNWRWRAEIDELWRKHAERQQLLKDEDMWAKKGKNWKWVSACLTKTFAQEEEKTGFGSSQKIVAVGESKYEGEWQDSKKNGVGRIWWHNGDRYLGDWVNDAKDGYGFMIWENGDRYEGTWRQDLRHGDKSQYFYSNGGFFCGTYVNDERQGNGEFVWPDGDKFVGVWQSGGRRGKGQLILKDGTVIEQEWNESPYVNYSDILPEKYPLSPAEQQSLESSHPHSG